MAQCMQPAYVRENSAITAKICKAKRCSDGRLHDILKSPTYRSMTTETKKITKMNQLYSF